MPFPCNWSLAHLVISLLSSSTFFFSLLSPLCLVPSVIKFPKTLVCQNGTSAGTRKRLRSADQRRGRCFCTTSMHLPRMQRRIWSLLPAALSCSFRLCTLQGKVFVHFRIAHSFLICSLPLPYFFPPCSVSLLFPRFLLNVPYSVSLVFTTNTQQQHVFVFLPLQGPWLVLFPYVLLPTIVHSGHKRELFVGTPNNFLSHKHRLFVESPNNLLSGPPLGDKTKDLQLHDG